MEKEAIQPEEMQEVQSSAQIAQLIEFAKLYLLQIDVQSLKGLVEQFKKQNSLNYSMTVLSASPLRLEKNELFNKQTDSIQSLLHFIESLIAVQEAKDKLKSREQVYDEIEKLFGL